MTSATWPANRAHVALSLFGLFFVVYLVSYSGAFLSTDERALFAAADSLAKRGSPTANQLRSERSGVLVGNATGDRYANYEPAQVVLVTPLIWLARWLPRVGLVHTALLFNALVTAATVSVLFLYLLDLGCRPSTGLITSGLFGLATIAWPYAKTFFREPLSALTLLAAACFLLRLGNSARRMDAGLAGFALGLAVATKQANLLALLALAPFGLSYLFQATSLVRARLRLALLVVTAALVVIIPSLLYGQAYGRPWDENLDVSAAIQSETLASPISIAGARSPVRVAVASVVDPPPQARIVLASVAGTEHQVQAGADPVVDAHSKTVPFWSALAGFLFSPGRSLFVFAPVLLAALVGVPLGWRKYRREMLLSAAVLAAHLVGYAALTPEGWHGGLCWGPRYLVPAVPLLCVPLAMVVAWVEDHPRTLWSLLFLLLCVLSIGVQLVGITVPGLTYAEDLNRLEPGGGAWKLAVYDPYYSQPLYSLRLLRLADMDYAWVHTDGAAVQIDWLFLAAAAAVLVAQAVLLARSLQRRLSRSAIGGLFLAGLCLALLLLVRRYEDPRFPGGDDRRAMLEDLRRQAAAGDVLVVTTGRVFPDYADFYLNYNKAALDSYVLKGTESELDPRYEALFARLIGRHERLWLATDKASGLGLWHPEEDWLLARLYPLQETAYSQYFRLFLFSTRDLPDPDRPAVQLDYTFGGAITLVGYDLPDRALHAGDALRLSLLWEARQAPPLDLTVFVQLLDPDGRLVVQADQYPVRGQRPTSSWQPGERIRDPYALLLPGDIPAGSYQLIVGLYELETMTRWSVANAAGLTLGDYVDLGSIEIE